jgi:PhoPQ-activated pathogenicity-related protein
VDVARTSRLWRAWRAPEEVDRVLWQHEVLIAVPWVAHSGNQHTAVLVVNGGGNDAGATTNNDALLGLLSVATGSVAAMVCQIPNQPLSFSDEQEPRIEDALLAYGMDKFLLTADPEWLVHLPMTKAVVRAMDTIQAFAAGIGGGGMDQHRSPAERQWGLRGLRASASPGMDRFHRGADLSRLNRDPHDPGKRPDIHH